MKISTGARKIAGVLLILVSLTAMFFFVAKPILTHHPDPYQITLNFPGRILPDKQVHPGTFTVEIENFSETANWTEGSLLAFKSHTPDFRPVISIEAWNPILDTPGVFEHIQKNFLTPKSWTWFTVKEILQSNDVLTAIPKRSVVKIIFFPLLALAISFACLGLTHRCFRWNFFPYSKMEWSTE